MKTIPTDDKIDVREWLTPLRRIETLSQLLRAGAPQSSEQRETCEMELADLEASLPAAIADPLRGRSRSARRMVAIARGHQCESCHTRVPRGDQVDLLLCRPVFCQFCGVLLYLDQSAHVAAPTDSSRSSG
jgi:predicted  nucleic acid-binding Zn-ribbon protein